MLAARNRCRLAVTKSRPIIQPRWHSNTTLPIARPTRSRTLLLAGACGAVAATYFLLPDASRSAPTSNDTPLAPSHFIPATLTSSVSCGPDTKLLTLTIPPTLLPRSPSFTPIWSVFVKDDDIQVERPYTPLYGIDEQGRMQFWIKRYPKGEVGRWLHNKTVGDSIEIRGPLQTWPWKNDEWDEVVMISGGTGFTPFRQLFHAAISTRLSPRTRFTLLASFQTPSDLPPPTLLEPLVSFADENPDNLRLRIFVDSHKESSNTNTNLQIGRIGKDAVEEALGLASPGRWSSIFKWRSTAALPLNANRNILFLVCGPEQMISAIAGPYGRNFSQGPVGGILGEMGFTSKQVYKL